MYMNKKLFKLLAPYKLKGDQINAVKKLTKGVKGNLKDQVLMGATGTGKTFTIANVIQNTNKKTLIMAANKTLAAQLYSEMKSLFPDNRVEYFISNFDFYQPEAYVSKSDTYIEKSAQSNMEIEMMRLSALNALTTRNDVIVIASVAAIYGEYNPAKYKELFFEIEIHTEINREKILGRLIEMGYVRNDKSKVPGSIRVRGDVVEISPGWNDEYYIRIDLFGDTIDGIYILDKLNKTILKSYNKYTIFPAKDYRTTKEDLEKAVFSISAELKKRLLFFKNNNKLIEHQRLRERTLNDINSLEEFGFCPGIENYAQHLEGRSDEEKPYTLIDYFDKDFLLVVDESHISIPQIGGMYKGDFSRKSNLVNYGFRLPSALNNRPLKFDEFTAMMPNTIYVSATPGKFESQIVDNKFVEQIIRPTGLLDPTIEIRGTHGQIDDIFNEINKTIAKNQRLMILTLTIKMSEKLTLFLKEKHLKVSYLHSELKTLERLQVIRDLRMGKIDIVIGINLLREGLDIPEIAKVIILDADKAGFLRDTRSLIQIIGRASRNKEGTILMYADKVTDSMRKAIDETDRRRQIQADYNGKHNITPTTIIKPIRDFIQNHNTENAIMAIIKQHKSKTKQSTTKLIEQLKLEMHGAAKELDFERAAELKNVLIELKAL